MASIQERLQLKRVPLDTWNIREQLCLASAVVRSGDQNWMSVSRALKAVGEPTRPPDWYSQKSCAAQYGVLLEHVETPKRKKRSSEGAVETPQESILKRLTQERIVEIQKNLAEMNQQYEQLKNEVIEVRNTSTSEERLKELWQGIEAAKRARERENARRAALMKEREERRARADRTWRPPSAQTPPSTPVCTPPTTPSSPLLTSLLKSSPVVTTPQHITHPANVVDSISPSAGAPTLSMLLEKGGTSHDNKHAAIEHIKSQLVQIEQQLIASTASPPVLPAPAQAPQVDIDDIEIKAEDVYAFSDIELHIPPVASMHKGINRSIEKPVFKRECEVTPIVMENTSQETVVDEVKELPVEAEKINEELVATQEETPQVQVPEREDSPPTKVIPEPEIKIAFPEVKFPTPEIKVIQPEDQKIKEEVEEAGSAHEKEKEIQLELEEPQQVIEETPVIEENTDLPPEPEVTIQVVEEPPSTVELPEPAEPETIQNPETIPLPPEAPETNIEPEVEVPPDVVQALEEPALVEIEVPAPVVPKDEPQEQQDEPRTEENAEERADDEQKATDSAPKEDDEDSTPLKELIKEEVQVKNEEIKEPELEPETHTETDDDTPMELSREEEKDGKKRKDYSRKKKPDSRTCSGSESAEASAPESPVASASDAERQHRLWKKSVMLVYSRLCAHKYASLFVRPISDEEAPGYSVVVKRPMDLTTIRRNIESGLVRTTAEFQRDVLLMLSNALMYNSSEHSVYQMAKEMHEEAACQLGMLLAAQAHAGLRDVAPRRKRRAPLDTPPAMPPAKRPHL